MNKALASLLVFIGLFVGYALSTVVARVTAEPTPYEVTVGGEFGAPVTVTVSGEYNEQGEHRTVLIEGEGTTVEENAQAFVRATDFVYSGDEWTQVADVPTLYATAATPDGLGEYYDDVVGRAEGTRLVVTTPDGERLKISVIDIMNTNVITGDIQSLPASDGLPAVSSTPEGIPQVDQGGGPVGTLKIVTQVAGDGVQVKPEDTIYANYMLVSSEGEVLESTFGTQGVVPEIVVGEVFPGLQQALADQRVGSRVIAAVPAALAQGSDDLAIIIDILGVNETVAD